MTASKPHISQLAATIQDGIDSDSGEYSVQDAAEVALRSLLEQYEALRNFAEHLASGEWDGDPVLRDYAQSALDVSNPASRPTCTCPAGTYDFPNAVHESYCVSNQEEQP